MDSKVNSNPITIDSMILNQTKSIMPNFDRDNLNLDLNFTTIEIRQNLDLYKDNRLIEFNQLEDIFNFCNPRNTIQIKLKKGLRGLGISLCGGKSSIIDEDYKNEEEKTHLLINQLIRVKKLYPAHPASDCGLIDENDFILDVNNHCFVGLTYIEAFNILHSVQDEVELKIFKFNQCPLQKYLLVKDKILICENSSFQDENVFESTRISDLEDDDNERRIRNVVLIKKDGSLGFTISKIENGGFYIKQITKAPATEAKIYPGDKILSVNGTSLDGLNLNDAIKLLRSLPDLCEFKLEQSNHINNLSNYGYQVDDDNKFKNKQLRHEVKIMLNSRNKDLLHNRLKRKELKKLKEDSIKQQNKTNEEIETSFESKSIDCELGSQLRNQIDSGLLDENFNKSYENELENGLKDDKFDKENVDICTKKSNNQIINENIFCRQNRAIEFGRSKSNENSLSKQNNLNKWRNQIMILNDEQEDKKCDENQSNQNVNTCLKKKSNHLDGLNDNDEQDSGFDDLMIRTNRTIDQNNSPLNCIKSSAITSDINKPKNYNENQKEKLWNKKEPIQLTDIEIKMNSNFLVNENSIMYRNIENSLFFYVVLDRIGWHGRIGFSLTDDEQYSDFRVVQTLKYGFSACIVKEIYPNSLAYSNGNINIGDKLLEVNNQPMINKPVQTVIKELRKMKGKLRLLFLRKVY